MLEGLKCFLTLQSGMQEGEKRVYFPHMLVICRAVSHCSPHREAAERGEQMYPGNVN